MSKPEVQGVAAKLIAMAFHSPHSQPEQPRVSFASSLAQPLQYAAPAPQAPASPQPAAIPGLPTPTKRGRQASLWLFGLLALMMLGLAGYFLWALGPEASVLGLVLAIIPLAIVFVGVKIIDRWEPEPLSLLIFAVAWGAVVSVAVALVVDLGLTMAVGQRADMMLAVVQAPIVEEVAKALGLLVLVVIARRSFDGPVDGVVYGALIGAGFAFTENIQYFAISALEGGLPQLTLTFVVRGLLSPFAHAMFTCATGFAIGLAMRKKGTAGAAFRYGLVGLLVAIALHAFWNGIASNDFFPLYFALQVPLFVGFILGIAALRREEARITRARLTEYAEAGWFTAQEVNMLATPAGRRTGMAWAAALPGDRRPLMKQFIRDAAELAAVRQRALRGRDRLASEDERALLQRTRVTRAALLAY